VRIIREIIEESEIKETKEDLIKPNKRKKEDMIKDFTKYDYDGPSFPVQIDIPNEKLYSKVMGQNNAKKVFIESELFEQWQLMTDMQRNQLKARMFLKKSKLFEDDLIKVGVRIIPWNANSKLPEDLYSKKEIHLMRSKKHSDQDLTFEVFYSPQNESNAPLGVVMELSNKGFSFTPKKSQSGVIEHKTVDFSEAIRGYNLILKVHPQILSEYTPKMYRRQIRVELPVSKLLIPIPVHSQTNFLRQLNLLDLSMETSTYSIDEEFFPSSKEFLHVFRHLKQIKDKIFGGYFKCIGTSNLFFLRFQFSEDFLVFKVSAQYDSVAHESRLKMVLKYIVMLLSDFYV
jgi:hypothetical protein